MIDVKEAANQAREYLLGLYGDSIDAMSVRLEEVEMRDAECQWFITVSFRDNPAQPHPWFESLKGRQYKVFTIDAESGKVLAMKIRQLEGA